MKNNKPSEQVIKITQALGFLLDKDPNHKLERVKLIKLLWAADRYHLRNYGRTVSEGDYLAFRFGPVASLALAISQQDGTFALTFSDIAYVSEFFTSDTESTAMSKNPGDDYLSETDKEALEFAWEKFSKVKTFELADGISHKYPEWACFAAYFAANNRSPKQIDMEKFFENPAKDAYFYVDDDRLASARETYLENRRLRTSLGA